MNAIGLFGRTHASGGCLEHSPGMLIGEPFNEHQTQYEKKTETFISIDLFMQAVYRNAIYYECVRDL